MNTYTNKLKKRMPAAGDFDWDDEWWDNEKIDDFVEGCLLSQNRILIGGVVTDGGGLNIAISECVAVVAGARYTVAAGSEALTDDSINYVSIDNIGTIAVSPGPPTGDYACVAIVDTEAGAVVRIGDTRVMGQSVSPGENIFINGAMEIDQANSGAAVTVSTAAKYVVDMLKVSGATSAAQVSAQQATGFGGFAKAAKLTVTTQDTLAAGELGHGFNYLIEYKDAYYLGDRYLSFQFKFKSNKTGTYSVALCSGDLSKSYVTTFSYSVSEAVQTVDVLIPVPAANIIEGGNNRGLLVYIGHCAITTYATSSLNQWLTGTYVAAIGTTDWEATNTNYISMTGLHGGVDVRHPIFPFRLHSTELSLCQRYYTYTMWVYAITMMHATNAGRTCQISFPTTMRNTPIITESNVTHTGYAGTPGSVTGTGATTKSFGLVWSWTTATAGHGHQTSFHYEADARM